jgi:hypothetical protein
LKAAVAEPAMARPATVAMKLRMCSFLSLECPKGARLGSRGEAVKLRRGRVKLGRLLEAWNKPYASFTKR